MIITTMAIRNSRGEPRGCVTWEGRYLQSYASIEGGLRQSLRQWVTRGLQDWSGEGSETHRRFTEPDDPDLPERLAEYIRQQTGLLVTVEKTGEQ